MPYRVRRLEPATWDVFAELVERNNGVFGGCWCLGFHPETKLRGPQRRDVKQERVLSGRAHAALVVDDDGLAQGWCQYGDVEELPAIKHRREYEKDVARAVPDWRITCVFVDKKHRKRGVASAAVAGALEQIAQAGGGLVEVISEVTDGRSAASGFLFSGTAELFEELGFIRGRQVGKHAYVLSRVIDVTNGAR